MAWIDGEELAVDETFVLSALADAVAVRRQQEERLVFAKRFWFRAFRTVRILPRDRSAVLKHPVLHILVAVGELGRKHDFGMAVGIFSTHDFELLRGHAGQPCQIVCKCFGDSPGGNLVRGLTRLETVDRTQNRLAIRENPFRAAERAGLGGIPLPESFAFFVVELHDGAIREMLENR